MAPGLFSGDAVEAGGPLAGGWALAATATESAVMLAAAIAHGQVRRETPEDILVTSRGILLVGRRAVCRHALIAAAQRGRKTIKPWVWRRRNSIQHKQFARRENYGERAWVS